MTTRRTDCHAALNDAVSRRESDWVDADGNEIHDHDRGLLYDLGTMNRRRALGLLGGVGTLAALAACSTGTGSTTTGSSSSTTTSSGTSSSSSGSTTTSADTSGGLTEVPDETGGPYPADGSNGVNVLDDSGIVRADIRSSFGSSTTTAAGVPLTIKLTVRDTSTGAAKTGAATKSAATKATATKATATKATARKAPAKAAATTTRKTTAKKAPARKAR